MVKLRSGPLIERLGGEGVTIFLTTHSLEEAERLADRVALLVEGQIVACDTVAGLKGRVADGDAMARLDRRVICGILIYVGYI